MADARESLVPATVIFLRRTPARIVHAFDRAAYGAFCGARANLDWYDADYEAFRRESCPRCRSVLARKLEAIGALGGDLA